MITYVSLLEGWQTGAFGFESLASVPPSGEDLRRFFQAQRDAFERSEAVRAWRKANCG
jgi:hypothetical protein